MSLDPTRIRIESHAVPIWQQQPSFQELMAEQVRHAPWLGLAILIHGLALLILINLDFSQEQEDERVVRIRPPEKQETPEPPKEPEDPPEEEVVPEEPVLQEADITEETEEVTEDFEVSQAKDSALDHDLSNAALGLGPNAGGKYGNRGKGGGGPRGGRAWNEEIERALEWLAVHQDADGKWDGDSFMKHDDPAIGAPCDGAGNSVHDVGVTGLALLAFLGDGNALHSGPYREVVKDGVNWLRNQQEENGLLGGNASHDFVYDHAIAAYALAEAYGLSEARLLRPYAQKAIDYLEYHRNPYRVWRYQPQNNDNDTSVTGWCVMAYESARYFGLDVNDQAMKYAATWFDEVAEPTTGRHGYTRRGELSSRRRGRHETAFPPEKGEAMTAVALFCRYFMKQDPEEHPIMETAADLVAEKPPVWDPDSGAIDHYYWYYASYALYQHGGRHWREWSRALTDAVAETQRRDGNFEGSWDPIGVWGEDGGRVYSTALLVLTLQVYYRYTILVH